MAQTRPTHRSHLHPPGRQGVAAARPDRPSQRDALPCRIFWPFDRGQRNSRTLCVVDCYGWWILAGTLLLPATAVGLENITFTRDGRTVRIEGRLIVEAGDGGLLIEGQDGFLWTVQPEELRDRTNDENAFEPLQGQRLVLHLQEQLPAGIKVHTTAHYVIFYDTSKTYAQWCGGLYERLYTGFYNYWRRRGMKLHPPEFPLIALVFRDKATYVDHGRGELGDAAGSIVGYYSLESNRMVTYDLTGLEQQRHAVGRRRRSGDAKHIQHILSRPQAAPLVATLIHEATHQLSYNSGLQSRHVHNPLWLSEGLAIYFETPDLKRSKGWRTIGQVHPGRLRQFRSSLATRDAYALKSLVSTDDRLREPASAIAGYAESWALCYYLLHVYPEEFVAFLQEQSARAPLVPATPDERLARFRRHFGQDLHALDREFLRYVEGLR